MHTLPPNRSFLFTRLLRYAWIGVLLLLLTACHQDMYNQPRYQTYDPSTFFEDGRSSRANVVGAVAVDQAITDEYFNTGLIDGEEVDLLPVELTADLLDRGEQQYQIYCVPCHGNAGYGRSPVADYGGIVPANFHQQRLRDAPISHFYVTITNGFYRGDPENGGYQSMYSYASRITPEDRWAISAYIRALQLSQNATLDDVPPDQRANLGN
jgi:mono/diheme cytochrome c family protein